MASVVGALGMSGASLPAGAQAMKPDTLFGITIGQPLEQQFAECPKNDKGAYDFGYHKGDTPCWVQDTYSKQVKLPLKVVRDTGAGINSDARIRIRDGVVVEIEVHAHGEQWRQVERYLMRHYGKPSESETYERDSRVSGISKVQTHTWRANGITMYFDQRASSDNTRIRVYSEAWQALEARERAERSKP